MSARREACLYKLHHRMISHISVCCNPCRREGIWQDLENDVASCIGDGQGGDGDCAGTLAKRIASKLSHQSLLTPRLILQYDRSAIPVSTTDVAHGGRSSCCSAFARLLPRRQECALVAVARCYADVKLETYICGMNDK